MRRINLKITRKRKNLSQTELANIVGITYQAISKFETGKLNPSYEVMEKIAVALDESVDYLFFNKNSNLEGE